jgi:hypothetical protein
MSIPSYYFTLFKKFQVIDHVPAGFAHGSPGGLGGFNLNNPSAAFGNSNRGALLGANPASSPLWAILNAKATNQPNPVINGVQWPAMPQFATQAWTDLQINAPAPNLVQVFADWITAGKVNDIPTDVLNNQKPTAPIPGPLDQGISLFVCSMANDAGIRPDAVPNNFWSTSLIFLVDPQTGNTVFPATLTGGTEYDLVAVIGNRGNTDAGIYLAQPGTGVEAAAAVMVWNTIDSPGVQLPALSNLDLNDKNGIYAQYFLKSAQYDVVGFRMNVQTVYDGIIAALKTAITNNPNLIGGADPQTWVKNQPAHLCAKVVIRQQGSSFPNFGDSPINNARIAQKNLAPFDINLQVVSPDPNINWKNFIVGQPLFFRLPDAGRNSLTLQAKLPAHAVRLYLAMPKETFEQVFRKDSGSIKGFKVLSREEICRGILAELGTPFPAPAVLEYEGGENVLEIPPLAEGQYLGMSLGIEYSVKRLKHGQGGEITLVHRALLPRLVPGTRCFELENIVAGGFTIVLRVEKPVLGK